jgi:hypothetical protein
MLGIAHCEGIIGLGIWYQYGRSTPSLSPSALGLRVLSFVVATILTFVFFTDSGAKPNWRRLPLLVVPLVAIGILDYRGSVLAFRCLANPTPVNLMSVIDVTSIYLIVLFLWILIFPLRVWRRPLSEERERACRIATTIVSILVAAYIASQLWPLFRIPDVELNIAMIGRVGQAIRRATIAMFVLVDVIPGFRFIVGLQEMHQDDRAAAEKS